MKKKQKQDHYNFTPVSMFFIVVGAIIFSTGLISIIISLFLFSFTLSIIMTIGGTLIMIGGYTNLELGLIRKELSK